MILTAGASPIFLTKNYINQDVVKASVPGILTASSMQALVERILNMDPFDYWQGSTDDDAVTETINIELFEGESAALRTLGFLALLNINFKAFTVALSDDSGVNFHTTYTETAHAASYWIKDISTGTKTANFIRITATTTQAANDYKKLGTAVAAGVLMQMTATPSMPMDRNDVENSIVNIMADGSKDITYIKHSNTSFTFYAASLAFKYMTNTEYRALQAMRRDNPVFLFYPEPGDCPDEIFFCRFSGALKRKYSSEYKAAGHDLSFSVEEIA